MNDNIKGKLFLSRMYPHIEAELTKPGVSNKINEHIQKVIGSDRLMKALELNHPGETVYFGDKDTSSDQVPIYEALNLNSIDVKKAIKDTGVVQSSWAHANKPLYWVLMLVIRHHMKNKDEDKAKMAVLLMAIAMYAGLQFRYFRRFYQANVMAYAMNTLTDKFTLKQEGSMIKSLLAISWRSHIKYSPDLESATDQDLLKYLVSMWGRLNGMIKALKNHYEITRASGNYLNQGKDRYDDDNLLDH